jgi:hypothetical protein
MNGQICDVLFWDGFRAVFDGLVWRCVVRLDDIDLDIERASDEA